MDRPSAQKINKERQALYDTFHQRDLTDIYRTSCPKATEYTFFAGAHETFSRIDHMVGHKVIVEEGTSVNLRKLESHQSSSLNTML